jgi:hypothetical protein
VILVSGSDSILEDLETIELGTVNLGEMRADEILVLPLKLPEGITNETGVNEVKVDVKFPDLATKELTVTNLQPINVPAGLQVQIITKQLELLLRGPKEAIETVKAENIKVTVDFSGEQVGTATVKAKITVSVAGVGAVGTYNVTATVKEK